MQFATILSLFAVPPLHIPVAASRVVAHAHALGGSPSSRATIRLRNTFSASSFSLRPVDACLNFPLWSRQLIHQTRESRREYRLPAVFLGLPVLLFIDSSIHMKLLAPLGQLRQSEADRAAHHAVMGNLLSLEVSIYQRGADAQVAGGRVD